MWNILNYFSLLQYQDYDIFDRITDKTLCIIGPNGLECTYLMNYLQMNKVKYKLISSWNNPIPYADKYIRILDTPSEPEDNIIDVSLIPMDNVIYYKHLPYYI